MPSASAVRCADYVALILCSQLPAIYYAEYRSVERKVASQPGVTIVDSWKHEDVSLEDCGFTLKVRSCPLVRVDFYEGEDWFGMFRQIDGVAIRSGRETVKLIDVGRLNEMGIPVRNLPELLDNMEGVLAVADEMEPAKPRLHPAGRWVQLRFPPAG